MLGESTYRMYYSNEVMKKTKHAVIFESKIINAIIRPSKTVLQFTVIFIKFIC